MTIIELDNGSVFVGDTLVTASIQDLKYEIDMDQEPNLIKGIVVDAYIAAFECDVNSIAKKYQYKGPTN